MKIELNPERIFLLLMIVVASLTIVSYLGQISRFVLGHGRLYGLVPLFHLNQENNIPTWYASLSLFLCGVVCGFIAYYKASPKDRYFRYWIASALMFILLSIDEAASMHELVDYLLRNHLDASFLPHYAWVVPGAIVVLLVGLLFFRFWWHLPLKTRLLFVVAGVIFVGGALGIEFIGGIIDGSGQKVTLMYETVASLEEFCEMTGVAILIYALLDYIRADCPELDVQLIFTNAKDAV